MRNDEKFKYHFVASGYSDDCGYLDGATHKGEETDESVHCHN